MRSCQYQKPGCTGDARPLTAPHDARVHHRYRKHTHTTHTLTAHSQHTQTALTCVAPQVQFSNIPHTQTLSLSADPAIFPTASMFRRAMLSLPRRALRQPTLRTVHTAAASQAGCGLNTIDIFSDMLSVVLEQTRVSV